MVKKRESRMAHHWLGKALRQCETQLLRRFGLYLIIFAAH
jgi:hypothetical protein